MIKAPQELIDVFKRDACGLYIGAGLSMASGFPSWKGLLEHLIDKVKALPIDTKSKIKDYESLIKNPDKYLLLAEDLKSQFSEADYQKYISDLFTDASKKPSETMRAYVKLPSRFIITTNYDSLIEQAYYDAEKQFAPVITFDNSRSIAFNLWENKFFILKAHGDVRINLSRIVLTERDYRNIIFREPGYQSALHSMFTYKSVLFVGSSFSDPDLVLFLRFLHNSFHGGGPKHYILLSKDTVNETLINRYLNDFNLHVIPYDSRNDHKELLTFAKNLAKSIKA